jgi:hypothetical protein
MFGEFFDAIFFFFATLFMCFASHHFGWILANDKTYFFLFFGFLWICCFFDEIIIIHCGENMDQVEKLHP